MNSESFLREEEKTHKYEGNPIIDIFYEAVNRFGSYFGNVKRIINLHHILP